jgi:hypothetical protein
MLGKSMTYQPVGDAHADKDNLVVVLCKFREAYQDFDVEPHPDEVAELSSWTNELHRACTGLEDYYGTLQAKAIIARAWQEVRP